MVPCLTRAAQPGMPDPESSSLGRATGMAQASRPRPGERTSTASEAGSPDAGSRAASVNLLNWPHLEVRRMVALRRSATACLHCGMAGELERFGTQHPLCLDLPIHGKQVALRVIRQRYRCRPVAAHSSSRWPTWTNGTPRPSAWRATCSAKPCGARSSALPTRSGSPRARSEHLWRAHPSAG
jgi:hypothetical protein